MDLITASLLLEKANKEITKDTIKALFEAIDGNFDEDVVELYLSKIENKSFTEIKEKGDSVIREMSISVAQSQPQASSGKAEEAVVEEEAKKEEVVEEVSLFGGDDDFF